MSFDHIELRFYLNGQEMISVHGIKGTVYPVFYGKGNNVSSIYTRDGSVVVL